MKSARHFLHRQHGHRWSQLLIVNLRILLGFAFVPPGLKKVLYQPFTDPQNTGAFHEFLHAFYATGAFYSFVGFVQLLIAVLLMTQTFAALGALMALPVIACITVFCWSTGVVPTAIVVTLMLMGTLVLILWDFERWAALLWPHRSVPTPFKILHQPINFSLWRTCGFGILSFYGISCLLYGGVYRPKGLEFTEPAFYILPLMALFPFITLIVERHRREK